MKKIILGLTSVFLLSSFTLNNVSAKEVTSTTYITPIQNDEFSIIDSHIQETLFEFKIVNESQLEQKIGKERLLKLKEHLKKQNIEKSKEFDRDAVSDGAITLFRKIGATAYREWWGTRIITHLRNQSLAVREVAKYYSGREGILSASTAIIAFVGGPVGTFIVAFSLVSGLDSMTWGNVDSKISDKLLQGRSNLTIDINGWIMDAKVY